VGLYGNEIMVTKFSDTCPWVFNYLADDSIKAFLMTLNNNEVIWYVALTALVTIYFIMTFILVHYQCKNISYTEFFFNNACFWGLFMWEFLWLDTETF